MPTGGHYARSVILGALTGPAAAFADPLHSWSEGDAKAAIVGFVEGVTDPASDSFVPEDDRIAVFDNDGTLWSEQPLYFQALYALDAAGSESKGVAMLMRATAGLTRTTAPLAP